MKKISIFKWTFLFIASLSGFIFIHSLFLLKDAVALGIFSGILSALSAFLFKKAP